METHRDHRHPQGAAHPEHGRWRRTVVRWGLANSLLAGLFALAWLVLRSGRGGRTRGGPEAGPEQVAAAAVLTGAGWPIRRA